MSDRASEAYAVGFLPGEPRIYDIILKHSQIPLSTLHDRVYGDKTSIQRLQRL